jgi:hypothetical protein
MSWFAYGATIALEIHWPSGIVATSFGMVACGACLLLIGLAARDFGKSEGRNLAEAVVPVETQDRPRQVAA